MRDLSKDAMGIALAICAVVSFGIALAICTQGCASNQDSRLPAFALELHNCVVANETREAIDACRAGVELRFSDGGSDASTNVGDR